MPIRYSASDTQPDPIDRDAIEAERDRRADIAGEIKREEQRPAPLHDDFHGILSSITDWLDRHGVKAMDIDIRTIRDTWIIADIDSWVRLAAVCMKEGMTFTPRISSGMIANTHINGWPVTFYIRDEAWRTTERNIANAS